MSNGRLSGKVAIVTGAAQGIGAAYVRGLAAEGAAVGVCDLRDPAGIVAEIAQSGGRATGAIVDVTDAAAIREFVAATERALGPIDILVNNAGLFGGLTKKPFTEIDLDEWERVLRINTGSVLLASQAVVPGMRARKAGKIINIASTTFHSGTPTLMHYVASKGAVVAMTRSMARELGDDGIAVNCIAPGLTSSDAVKNDPGYSASIPMAVRMRAFKREQQPEDLIGPLCFLASDDCGFMTGQTIVVDGGGFML